MKYELQLFEKIIHDDLSPSNENPKDPFHFHSHLEQQNKECFIYKVVNLKYSKKRYTLLEDTTVSSLHPAFEWLISPHLHLFGNDIDNANHEVVEFLQIDREKLASISFNQRLNKTIFYVKLRHTFLDLPVSEAKYYYYNDILKAEVLRIKQKLQDEVFANSDRAAIEEYIHKQQQAFLTLSFKVMWLLDRVKQNEIFKLATDFKDTDILNLVYIRLEELLIFIERHFPQFIDDNVKIPCKSALLQINKTAEKLEIVISKLQQGNIEPGLLQIISEPLIKLSSITLESRITYRELLYGHAYLDAFYEVIKTHNKIINEAQIKTIVYQVNYNSLPLFNYEVDAIKINIYQMDNITDRINHLYLCLKLINQRICRANISYDPHLPTLKVQLTNWVEEEINYLSKSLEIKIKPDSNFVPELRKVKLKSSLTVAQISLFYKIMVETGIIAHKDISDVFNHISSSYSTNNASDISFDSIRNKFYNPEQSTLDVIKGKIIEMLNHVKAIDLYK